MIVIAVGNLAVEPEIGLFLFANIFKFLEKFNVNAVRRIKAESVNIKLINPESCAVEKIVHNLVIVEIKLYKVIVTCPALIAETVIIRAVVPKVYILKPRRIS